MQSKEGKVKVKKERKETLLLKYGFVAIIEILVFMTTFLVITTYRTRKPISDLYKESVETVLDQSVENAET